MDGVSLAVLAPAADALGEGEDAAGRLTGRELEIAVLVAQGHPTKTIAYRLQISEWTVATYIRRIYCKLNVDNRAAMVYRLAALIDARVSHGGRHAGTDRSGRAAR